MDLLGVGPGSDLLLHRVQAVATLVDGTRVVADDDVLHAHALHEASNGDARSTGTREDHLDVAEITAGQAARVDQRGTGHDRGAMLVVMEDGNVAGLLEATLNLEAARRGDVLEVHAAKAAGEQLHGAHDLIHVVGADAQGEGVHVGEGLEESTLALHDGHARLGANVAQAENRGAIGHNGDEVPATGVLVREARILLDLQAGNSDARRVGHGKLLRRADLGPAHDLDLAVPLLVCVKCVLLCIVSHLGSFDERGQLTRPFYLKPSTDAQSTLPGLYFFANGRRKDWHEGERHQGGRIHLRGGHRLQLRTQVRNGGP